MAKLGDFIAFQAAVALLKDKGKISLLDDVYKSVNNKEMDKNEIKNFVRKSIPFSYTEVSKK